MRTGDHQSAKFVTLDPLPSGYNQRDQDMIKEIKQKQKKQKKNKQKKNKKKTKKMTQ